MQSLTFKNNGDTLEGRHSPCHDPKWVMDITRTPSQTESNWSCSSSHDSRTPAIHHGYCKKQVGQKLRMCIYRSRTF